MMVAFGNASGPVDPVGPAPPLAGRFPDLTRPTLGDYIREREERDRRAADLFGWISKGELDVVVGARFALAEAADAQRALGGERDDRQGGDAAVIVRLSGRAAGPPLVDGPKFGR